VGRPHRDMRPFRLRATRPRVMAVGLRFVAQPDGEYSIRLKGNSPDGPCVTVGQWLSFFDVDAFDGLGEAHWTADPEDALTFADFDEAQAFWSQQSKVRPMLRMVLGGVETERDNRPLTVVSVTVETLP
jgi:hypothetical protein